MRAEQNDKNEIPFESLSSAEKLAVVRVMTGYQDILAIYRRNGKAIAADLIEAFVLDIYTPGSFAENFVGARVYSPETFTQGIDSETELIRRADSLFGIANTYNNWKLDQQLAQVED